MDIWAISTFFSIVINATINIGVPDVPAYNSFGYMLTSRIL